MPDVIYMSYLAGDEVLCSEGTGVLPSFGYKPKVIDVYIIPSLIPRLFKKCIEVYIVHIGLYTTMMLALPRLMVLLYLQHSKHLATPVSFIVNFYLM